MKPQKEYNFRLRALCFSAIAGISLGGLSPVLAQQDDSLDDEDVYTLSPFEVDASQDQGYYTNQSLAGGRVNANLSDMATTVQVMTDDFLNDIGATGMDEVMLYATNADAAGRGSDYMDVEQSSTLNVDNSTSRQSPSNSTNIRALGKATRTVDYYETDIPFDSYISGRVDINRGANSFLFGLGSPGGIINSSTDKASLSGDSNKVDFQVSTENFEANTSWRASLNLNRVLIEDKLAIRFAGLTNNETYTQKPAMKDTERAYAAITFKPFKDKRLTLRASYEGGNIYSNPVNRLGPLETLSTFLDNPQGIVWPVTAENPSGRIWIDGYAALNAGSTAEGTASSSYRWLGLDNDGNTITNWGNADSAPVGRGWALVFDGTETSDGYPTRAFQLQTRGTWVTGNAVFDPQGDWTTGQKNSIFYGAPAYQDLAAIYTNWPNQGLTNYDVYDFRTNLISGGLDYYENDWNRKNVTLEYLSDDSNYGIEISADSQTFERDSYVAVGNPMLSIDVNYTLPIGPNDLFGETNPNFGRPYIYTQTPTRTRAKTERTALRATGFAKFDFEEKFEDSGFLKWLGRHTITGLLDKSEKDYSDFKTVLSSTGGDVGFHVDDDNVVGNNRRTKSIIYLGPQQLNAWDNGFGMSDFIIDSVPGDLKISSMDGGYETQVAYWNVGDPATDARYNTVSGDEYTGVTTFSNRMVGQNGKLQLTEVESWAINLQSFFLGDHLVANLGWRGDSLSDKLNSKPPTDEDTNEKYFDSDVFNFQDENTVIREASASNFAYGIVAKVPAKYLPESYTVDFHYGESSNFIPSVDGYDMDGNLTPSSDGETIDYGITISKRGKFSVRLNFYEGNSTNLGPDAGAGVGFNYGVMAHQAGMNILRDLRRELDDYDWDMDGQFDDPTIDANGDGIVDDSAANNPMSLQQLHTLYAEWNENLVTPYMKEVTGWEFTPSSAQGANDASWVLGSELYYVLKDTVDLVAEGTELELTYNPTKNWRLAFNATQQSSVYSNSYARLGEFGRRYGEIFERNPGIELFRSSGNFLTDTPRASEYASNSLYGKYFGNSRGAQTYLYYAALDGTEDPKVREYRFNFVSNYSFSDGVLKGLNVGGAIRYQSKSALGFALVEDDATGTPYPDPEQAYYDDAREYVDIWAGYKRKILDGKVDWKVQLNIRNLFASNDPLPAQYLPDGNIARVSIPAPRQIILRNTFSF